MQDERGRCGGDEEDEGEDERIIECIEDQKSESNTDSSIERRTVTVR